MVFSRKSFSSSILNTSCKLISGTGWDTFSNWLNTSPPTRFVGESALASSGWALSSSSSSR